MAVLAVVAIAGIALAAHGWSVRQATTPGSLAAGSSAKGAAPAATPSAAGATGAPHTTAGPLLSSQSYFSYAFQVWPGTLSPSAKTAMTGLIISVHRSGQGISVAAGVAGQATPASTLYPAGAKVYVIEASLGDDANNSDYNLGDDGLVVTDSSGRIVQ
jgi:hypothetical protein